MNDPIADIPFMGHDERMRSLLAVSLVAFASTANAAEGNLCGALEGLKVEAQSSHTPQRISIFKVDPMEFACGRTKSILAQDIPDDDILEFAEGRIPCCLHFAEMLPVDEGKVDRARHRVLRDQAKGAFEEIGEFVAVKLA